MLSEIFTGYQRVFFIALFGLVFVFFFFFVLFLL